MQSDSESPSGSDEESHYIECTGCVRVINVGAGDDKGREMMTSVQGYRENPRESASVRTAPRLVLAQRFTGSDRSDARSDHEWLDEIECTAPAEVQAAIQTLELFTHLSRGIRISRPRRLRKQR